MKNHAFIILLAPYICGKHKVMGEDLQIISTETLSHKYFPLKWVKYNHIRKDGSAQEVGREVYLTSNGATALLYNLQEKTVILISQFRMPSYLNKNATGILIETCAGLVEENEDPADSIVREIEEETGYRVTDVKKLFELYSTPGSVAELLHYFVASYEPEQRTGEGGGLADEHEEIEVIELPFEDAFCKIATGEIKDAKTVTLLQYARIHLFNDEKIVNT